MLARLLSWLAIGSLAVAPSFWPGARARDAVLDVQATHYREDAPGARPVAAVRAVLRARGSDVVVEVEVAAIGAGVDPLPGVEGAPGANLRTAEELHFLLADDALHLRTRASGLDVAGSLLRVERDLVPVRRLRPDGSIAPEQAPAALPVRVAFASAALPLGRSRSFLLCGDVPRLVVECERTATGGRIVAIDSLGEPMAMPGPERNR